MSVPIPHYLTDLAVLEKQTDTRTSFSIRCTCGCNQFFVYENHFSKGELAAIKPYCEAMAEVHSGQNVTMTRDENGSCHYWRLLEPQKGSEGTREEILVPRCPFFAGITVVKALCASCSKEHVVFDSRIHGYDGMTGVGEIINEDEWKDAKDGMIFKTLKGSSYTAYMLIIKDV